MTGGSGAPEQVRAAFVHPCQQAVEQFLNEAVVAGHPRPRRGACNTGFAAEDQRLA